MKILTDKTRFQPRYLTSQNTQDDYGEWNLAINEPDMYNQTFSSFREALEAGEAYVEENELDPQRLYIAILNISIVYPNVK